MKKILLILFGLLLLVTMTSCEEELELKLSDEFDSFNAPNIGDAVDEVTFRFEKITKDTSVDKVIEQISKYKTSYYNVTNYMVDVLESSDEEDYPTSKIIGTNQHIYLKHNSSGYYGYEDYIVTTKSDIIRYLNASYRDAYNVISGKLITYNNKNYMAKLYDSKIDYRIPNLPFELSYDDSIERYLNKGINYAGFFRRIFYLNDKEFNNKFPEEELSKYQSASFELSSNYIVLNITNKLGLFDKEMQDFVLYLNGDYYMNYKAYVNIEKQAIEYISCEFYNGPNELIQASVKIKLEISYRLDSYEQIADRYNSVYKYLKQKATKVVE